MYICQLGRTDKMTGDRKEFFKLEDIMEEFKIYLKDSDKFDIITILEKESLPSIQDWKSHKRNKKIY